MRHVLVCLYSAVLGLSEAQLGMMIELETESEEKIRDAIMMFKIEEKIADRGWGC